MSQSRMTDTGKESQEREAVRRERAAYARGARVAMAMYDRNCHNWDNDAATLYPMPKVSRPRVVRYFLGEAKIEDGKLWRRWPDGGTWAEVRMGLEDIRTLADLLNNPTELVEDSHG